MARSSSLMDIVSRLRRSHVVIALLMAVLLIIWLASGDTLRAQQDEPQRHQNSAPVEGASPVKVQTRMLQAQQYVPKQVTQGELRPLREVEVRSQTSAHLAERMVELGDAVEAGAPLFRLDEEDRAVQLARAEADVQLAEAELRAAERLRKSDLMSETDFLRVQAALAAARAAREQAALQQRYARIAAPIAGIVDRLPAEQGDYVQVGETLATIVDLSALELSAFIPQQQVQALKEGLPVQATLLDGTTLAGRLTYVAARAEASTRSFRVEALIDNPAGLRVAGASATLAIVLPEQRAHRITPALLVLNGSGEIGVKAVGANQRVEFLPVDILGFDTEGVWLDGLPSQLELITVGGGFVSAGEPVEPVRAEAP